MHKTEQKQILELLNTLEEASLEIKKFIKRKDPEAVLQVLADCYEFSAHIKDYVNSVAGKDTQTAELLENFREYIKEAFERIDQNIAAGGNIDYDRVKDFKQRVAGIIDSVKSELTPDRIEVVFFPYKASMWDSLESIWLAAKDDPQCDAYVVPIPYFDKMKDGTLGKMQYEGSKYPDYVPVVDWKTYDVETRRPDIIYTHYPYDDAAVNASIHPDFYSKRLRARCKSLVYVPYFVASGDTVHEHYCQMPGVLYAHNVIVQSEAVRQSYISHYKRFDKEFGWKGQFGKAEDKFVALGSPKFDKVINAKREDYELPDEWRRLIEKPDGTRKKVILYNTHMFKWLRGGEEYFEKIRSVFDIFKSRDDIVLWWRPHPNTELNFRTQRPQWLGDYRTIVGGYKRERFGIYDDTPDLHRAIALTDAYYGDTSSLIPLYQITGKPIFIQNASITKSTNKKNELKAVIRDFVVYNNMLWFVTSDMNALFCMDLDTNTLKYAGEITCGGAFDKFSFGSIEIAGDYLVLVPALGTSIVKYDLRGGTFERMPINSRGVFKFIGSYSYNSDIYMIPFSFPAIVKYNIESETISENKEICAELHGYITDKSKGYFLFNTQVDRDGYLMLVSGSNNIIVEYNLKSDTYKFHKVGDEKNHYSCIVDDGNDYWVFSQRHIIKWNKTAGIIAKLDNYPEGFKYGDNFNFQSAVYFAGEIFVFPRTSNMILKINTETNKVEEFANLDKCGNYKNRHFPFPKYSYAKRIGDHIYVWSLYENSFQRINPKTGEIENIPLILSDEDYSKVMHRPLFDAVKDTATYPFKRWEDSVVTLSFFLERLTSEDIPKENISFENESEVFGNTDGSSGRKSYEHIKSKLVAVAVK